jgi:integrase
MEVLPIRDVKKIIAMRKILRANGKNGPRDEALFVMGINTALRISDLLALRVADVTDSRGKPAAAVELKEKKTGKTKIFPLNRVVLDVLSEYMKFLKERKGFDLNSPLFPSRQGKENVSDASDESGVSGKSGSPGSICRWRARQILAEAGEAVGLERIGTHSLRKTFGYHVYQKTGNLGLVQKLLNHSSSADTLRYIGIDREQMDNTYLELNLGA